MGSYFSVVGRATGVVAARTDVWNVGGIYAFPPAPVQMSIVSTSTSDTAAGTGVRTLVISYLDSNYKQQLTTVTLNGTTPVLTIPTDILRINKVWAGSVGSGGVAAGNITISNSSVTYARVDLGYTASRQAIFTVPGNLSGYLTGWNASCSATPGSTYVEFDLRTNSYQGILYPGVFVTQATIGVSASSFAQMLPTPIYLPPRTDIKLTVSRTVGTQDLTCTGDVVGWLDTGV